MANQDLITIDPAPFIIEIEHDWLSQEQSDGAIATFIGKVRRYNLNQPVTKLTLEHYPGMTERVLIQIVAMARLRWLLSRVRIIHRIGVLQPGDPIVFVGVSSVHRANALNAVAFIMDHLKTQAPFWKKEQTPMGETWLAENMSDKRALARWQNSPY